MNKITAVKTAFKDQNRKPIYKIVKELAHSTLLEKEVPNHYFTSFLHKKGSPDYRGYIGNKKIVNIYNPELFTSNKIRLKVRYFI